MKVFKRFVNSILTVSLCLLVVVFLGEKIMLNAYTGLGDIRFEWEREIYQDVNLRHTMSYNQNKDQKTYTVDFNPKTAALKPIVTTGPGTVLYGNTMSSLINHYESQGEHVVFGFNGDGYDTSNSIPLGIGINNGILLNSANSGRLGWGLTSSGELKYGSTNLTMNFSVAGGSPINLAFVNKERKVDTNGVYFLTEDFYPTTDSTSAGVEVVLTVDAGQDGLRIGTPHKVTVESVKIVSSNTSKNKTAIGKGKAVLATHTNSPHYNTLKNLSAGQKITVNVNDNVNDGINWAEMNVGMGIFHLLLDNGVEQNLINTNKDVHPRTVMGVRADGSIVMMQNDGRQVGWAAGFTYKETVDYLRDEFNCVTVFNFDGGGSSTTAATLPGDEKATVLNRPSDGRERSNANAFLLVATTNPVAGNPAEKLHIYPSLKDNNANKGIILENGKLSFNVRATDRNYYPALFNGTVSYSVEGDIGSITTNGVFTAKSGSGTGKVIASHGDLEASFEIEVTNSITSVERDFTIISVAPGATTNLEFRALKDGIPIIMSNESLTFELNPTSLGTISSSGTFKATDDQGTGNLKVTYKTFSLTIPVEVGRMPHMILDFEKDIFASGWTQRYVNPGNGGSGNISINTDENFVKHGDGSLRIDYDFATKPLSGTVSLEIGETGNTVLEGQPTAISSWVYGDGNGGWYRVQLTGGLYAGDTQITWVGWKYIETEIPSNALWPITVQYPVRFLGTQARANNKSGTVYVDSVRAIYGFKNDDNVAPVINNIVSPTNGFVTSDRQQVISFSASDANTGINRARTQMYINGELVDNLQQVVNPDGSVNITYNPSALSQLSLGKQNIKVRVEDNFGNKAFKEWSFTVTTSSLNLSAELPTKTSLLAGEVFNYKINAENVDSFTNMEVSLLYNKDSVEFSSVNVADGVTLVSQVNDFNLGKITLILSGMNQTGSNTLDLLDVMFQVKNKVSGSSGIYVEDARVTASGSTYGITLPSYDVSLSNHYKIEVLGITSGSPSVITVTENGLPVTGVKVLLKHGTTTDSSLPLTDVNGKITTSVLTNLPIGTNVTLTAFKDDFNSDDLKVTILGTTGLVTMRDGASIRLKTEQSGQGLRFVGSLAAGLNASEHGFYLVYGKTNISELVSAINNQNGDLIINGKKVFHVVIPSVTNANEFSVVLTGIPEAGYLDTLSVISYVVSNGVKQYAEAPVARSVLDVALKMHKENVGGQEIENIVEKSLSEARVFGLNAFGEYEVNVGLYETNSFNLKEEFIKDWNAKFKTTWTELEAAPFFLSAKTGLTDAIGANNDISTSNLYKFFNDQAYKDKWVWLLDFFINENTEASHLHPLRQAEALKGTGINTDGLWHANHLSYSIANFFNSKNETGGYSPINFTDSISYINLKNYNFKIFIDTNKYIIVKQGNTITIPSEVPLQAGYSFDYYMVDGQQVMAGDAFVVNNAVTFSKVFTANKYTIKYYDGTSEYTSLKREYTAETALFDLPSVTKPGYIFVGWYDNNEFSGSSVLNVSMGSTGDKIFYAKWEEVASDTYTITYELNGGSLFLGYQTRDEMSIAFLTDFYNYLVDKAVFTSSAISINDFIHGAGKLSGFDGVYNTYTANLRTLNDQGENPAGGFLNQTKYRRWMPLAQVINEYIGLVNKDQVGQFWSSNSTTINRLKPFFMKTALGQVGVSHEILARIPEEYKVVERISSYTSTSGNIILHDAVRRGYVFAGWYLNSDFSGLKVTEISAGSTGNRIYYAKWE